MHNIDRTRLEFAGETLGETFPGELFEGETFEYPGELGAELPGEHAGYPGEAYGETYGETAGLGELTGEYAGEAYGETYEYPGETFGETYAENWEYPGEMPGEHGFGEAFEGLFSEQEAMDLAAELLEIGSEAELEQFLGRLAKRAFRIIRRTIPMPVVSNLLRNLARTALPLAAGAIGNIFVPGAGALIGRQLGALAVRASGLEAEGLSPEDRELAGARQFVQLTGEALRQAAMQPAAMPPAVAAQRALVAAAELHAPELAAEFGRVPFRAPGWALGPAPGYGYGPRLSGTWVRRGRRIVLYGV